MSQKTWLLIGVILVACVGTLCASNFPGFFSANGGRPDAEFASTDAGEVIVAATDHSSVEHDVSDEFVKWNQFRGENGQGISREKNIPTEWDDEKNLAWKTKLPGAGASSPILTKSYVFVTSYSGYGQPGERSGSANDLERHLSCIDRKTGKVIWTKTVANEAREDSYTGMGLPEHGYGTNTPVTNGELVFVFYGKSGVLAYDFEGNEKWRVSVGQRSANRRWGSAASLILYKDMVIVNASEEDRAIYALKQTDGEVVWKAPGESLELCYSTPGVVKVNDERTDLVVAIAGELWGINPENGKLAWYVLTPMGGNLSPSLNIRGNKVYAFGGYRQTGSIGVKVEGKGELDASNVLWKSRNTSYVPTPVLIGERFYWIDNKGMYYCTNAADGELVHRERVDLKNKSGHPVYASAIAINDLVYCQTRTSGLYVIKPSEQLEIVAHNNFDSDTSDFSATPAVDKGQLFLRSNQFLYCVQAE